MLDLWQTTALPLAFISGCLVGAGIVGVYYETINIKKIDKLINESKKRQARLMALLDKLEKKDES